MEQAETSGQSALSCPGCGAALAAALTDRPQVVDCPACGQAVVLPAADGSVAVAQAPGAEAPFCIDDSEDERAAAQQRQQERLDSLRMQQVQRARRAAVRSRSYALVVCLAALAAAGQLIFKAVQHARHEGWGSAPTLYLLTVPLCLLLAWRQWRRAQDYAEEADRSAIPEPEKPPEFDQLGDGSEQWRRLEEMGGGRDGATEGKKEGT